MNKKTTLKLNRDFRRLYYKGSSAVHPLIVTYASKNRHGSQSYRHHRYQKKSGRQFAEIAARESYGRRLLR